MSDSEESRGDLVDGDIVHARKAPGGAPTEHVDRVTRGLRQLNRAEQILVVTGGLFLILGLVVLIVAGSYHNFAAAAIAWFFAKLGGAMLISELIIRAARTPFPRGGHED